MEWLELLKISFVSACLGWSFVERLTDNRQIFDFIQGLYYYLPLQVSDALKCSYCVSGWVSIVWVLFAYNGYLWQLPLSLVVAPCMTFVFVHFIKK